MTEKKNLVKNYFPLILPKKHSLIKKRFLPFFGVLYGFLVVHFGGLNLYFDNFFVRNTAGSRATLQDGLLVHQMLILAKKCHFLNFPKSENVFFLIPETMPQAKN